jgi:hypothetical protein
VIIRISTEGQYELDSADIGQLNELDNAAVASCQSDDEAGFHATYEQLLDFVRNRGKAVADDHLGGSDLILPPPDVSLEEAKTEFTGEGLIPG